jgi:hypothetical protein
MKPERFKEFSRSNDCRGPLSPTLRAFGFTALDRSHEAGGVGLRSN